MATLKTGVSIAEMDRELEIKDMGYGRSDNQKMTLPAAPSPTHCFGWQQPKVSLFCFWAIHLTKVATTYSVAGYGRIPQERG
jgi:hypothetical protein